MKIRSSIKFDMFALTRHGECIGVHDSYNITKLLINKEMEEDGCINKKFMPCNYSDDYDCVGKANFVYLYGLMVNK